MFVTLEGPEGAGKSTLAAGLRDHLVAEGHDVLLTREPGAGEVGRAIREILLHGEALDAKAELLLFLADRAQHVAAIVRPHLLGGGIVICDRYIDSTVVYQGHARGLDTEWLRQLNRFSTGALIPDLTVLLDLDPTVGLSRLQDKNRLDREPLTFHEMVRQGFLAEARLSPKRFTVLDASRTPAEVLDQALAVVRSRTS